MEKTFIISLIGLFSLLIFNLSVIVKKDIEQTKKEELNQRIDNSIIHKSHLYNIKQIKLENGLNKKTIEQQLIRKKPLFS